MAGRILSSKGRVIAYLPNFRVAVKHFRAFSSYNEQKLSEYYRVRRTGRKTVWPDKNLGPLGPRDSRFPLPGSIGLSSGLNTATLEEIELPIPQAVLVPSTIADHHQDISQQLLAHADVINDDGFLPETVVPTPADLLECVAQVCPKTLCKDFQELFPDRDILNDPLTVITLSQKTENDMSGWSPDVEEEREALLETFMEGACEICTFLQQAGYWADFIDPSSGKPYMGPHTNASFFETDERYRQFGFEIDDLGCCKVIRHHVWGTHSYIGCLFTNAPLSHPVIQTMKKNNYVPIETGEAKK
ncbi:cobalamin trafficking protein CblD [Patella vulgata]|uniref:cobalamin trafficking protein CblD n=1 Tax=Patella vulgata TaxID=6465 RepID=UPI00217F2DC6|nr:cobalamin trafficking protein CblD [Patella vulgata]XP_050419239.1 cobalamin trafficking protein CblD [Patella vulgata]